MVLKISMKPIFSLSEGLTGLGASHLAITGRYKPYRLIQHQN